MESGKIAKNVGFASFICLVGVILAMPHAAASGRVSAWAKAEFSAVRLIVDGDGLAGIEFALQPGWHTYWRAVGMTGFPPEFDWSSSENVEVQEVHWPTPIWIEQQGFYVPAYRRRLVLPVRIARRSGSGGSVLALSFRYGICSTVCVPVRGSVLLDLDKAPVHGDAALILRDAIARVPRTEPGANGLEILSLRRTREGRRSRIEVTARFDRAPAEPQIFVSVGPWLAACGPSTVEAIGSNRMVISAPACGGKPAPGPLHLVLSDRGRAVQKILP